MDGHDPKCANLRALPRHLWVQHDVDFSGDMTDAYQWMTDGLLAMRSVYDLLV